MKKNTLRICCAVIFNLLFMSWASSEIFADSIQTLPSFNSGNDEIDSNSGVSEVTSAVDIEEIDFSAVYSFTDQNSDGICVFNNYTLDLIMLYGIISLDDSGNIVSDIDMPISLDAQEGGGEYKISYTALGGLLLRLTGFNNLKPRSRLIRYTITDPLDQRRVNNTDFTDALPKMQVARGVNSGASSAFIVEHQSSIPSVSSSGVYDKIRYGLSAIKEGSGYSTNPGHADGAEYKVIYKHVEIPEDRALLYNSSAQNRNHIIIFIVVALVIAIVFLK